MSKRKDMMQKTESQEWPDIDMQRRTGSGNQMLSDSSTETETSKTKTNSNGKKKEDVDTGSPEIESKDANSIDTSKQIKNKLREFRIEQMMSKAELARKAGLSVLTIDRIEKGFGCRMDTKRKILKALGLKLSDRRKLFQEE